MSRESRKVTIFRAVTIAAGRNGIFSEKTCCPINLFWRNARNRNCTRK